MEDEVFSVDELLKKEQDLSKVISILQKGRLTPLPKYEEYEKALDPTKHDVMDEGKRPNKIVNIDPNSPDYGNTRSIMVNRSEIVGEKVRIEEVARIALAFEQLIVKRAVGITFGNPVKYKSLPQSEAEKELYEAVMRVLNDAKEQTLNRKVARQVYGMTEVAERWYTTEGEKHTTYSVSGTTFKLRCVVFSPKYGDVLYPYFDDNRDMVAFSRSFKRTMADGHERSFFETLTADTFYMWETDGAHGAGSNGGWKMVDGYPRQNPYGKIPIIYGCQEEPDYKVVETLIKRMEKLLSNFADTNDYHASPKIVANGRITSFCKKGEAGAIIEVDPGADLKYLAWENAPESVKEEYRTLKELIHTLTQTPDISWDSVKGINVSGVALELMFMDAVLKVKDKEEIWLDYLTRRVNLIKAMLAVVDTKTFGEAAKTLQVEPEIIPYVVEDEQTRANVQLALAGNKQLKSRKTAMRDLGVENVEEEVKMIEEEDSMDVPIDIEEEEEA